MQSFGDFIRECGMVQDVPPDHNIKTWMNENRELFHMKHGKHEGERQLFAEAWKTYHSINNNEK